MTEFEDEEEGIEQLPFLRTRTSKLIEGYITRTRKRHEAAVIMGPPGVGKTATLEYLAANNSYVKLITITAANSTLRTSLCEIANAFQFSSLWKSAHDVMRVLQDGLGRDRFHGDCLLIDEAQNLDLKAFRTILEVHYVSRLPMIFVGNEYVLKRTREELGAFGQAEDRVTRFPPLQIHPEDVHAFGLHYNVEGRDAYYYLESFALPRSLRKLCRVLSEARNLAGPRGSIRLSHLRDAVAFLHGEDEERGLFKLHRSAAPLAIETEKSALTAKENAA